MNGSSPSADPAGVSSSLLLLGIGGAGCAVAKRIRQAYGPSIRVQLCDTDASSGAATDLPFALVGGNRLSGRGSGGDAALAREAFRDDPSLLDAAFNGVRICVIVCATGGGTAAGITREILPRLRERGAASLVFAAEPFAFEGDDRRRAARRMRPGLESEADAAVFLPLDDLVRDVPENTGMAEALSRAADTTATAVTLFWRLLEKPGYIRVDAEHLRGLMRDAGRARFATAACSGANRALETLVRLRSSPLMAQDDTGPVTAILTGILAGDDLRLAEIKTIADGLRDAFGADVPFRLGTVNDEGTFSGRLAVVTLVFSHSPVRGSKNGAPNAAELALSAGDAPFGAGDDAPVVAGANLDVPTYRRLNLTLDR